MEDEKIEIQIDEKIEKQMNVIKEYLEKYTPKIGSIFKDLLVNKKLKSSEIMIILALMEEHIELIKKNMNGFNISRFNLIKLIVKNRVSFKIITEHKKD